MLCMLIPLSTTGRPLDIGRCVQVRLTPKAYPLFTDDFPCTDGARARSRRSTVRPHLR